MSKPKLLALSKQQQQVLSSYEKDGDINPIISILREIKGNLYYQGGFGFVKQVVEWGNPILNSYVNSLPEYHGIARLLYDVVDISFFRFDVSMNYGELVASLPSEDKEYSEMCVIPVRFSLHRETTNPFKFDLLLETPNYKGSEYLTGFIGNRTNLPGVNMGKLTPYLRISKGAETLLEIKLPAISWDHTNRRDIFDPAYPVLTGTFQYEKTALLNKYLHRFTDPNPPKKQKYKVQNPTTEWNPEIAKFITF